MSGGLLPSTVEILRKVPMKPPEALFKPGTAADFDARHTRGRFKVLPCTDGWYVAFETGLPLGQGVRGRFTSAQAALGRVEELEAAERAKAAPREAVALIEPEPLPLARAVRREPAPIPTPPLLVGIP